MDRNSENQAYLEILQNVLTELQKRITPENESATAIVIANYLSRSSELQRKQSARTVDREEERKMRITVCEWEKEHVIALLELGETEEKIAHHYLSILDTFINRLSKNRFTWNINTARFYFYHKRKIGKKRERFELRSKIFALMEITTRFIVEKLKEMSLKDENPVIRKISSDYVFKLSIFQRGLRYANPDKDNLLSVVSHAFQTERDNILTMLELGRISPETAKEMRHNISLLEVQLKKEYF